MGVIKPVIKFCFENPDDTLGRSEDSCHIKIVFLLLWELGWDPIHQIMLGFEIPKERMWTEQKAAVVPDIVVADDQGTYLVGEVKHWYATLGDKHINQIRGYQRALNSPLAFLTNGHHWIVFDAGTGNTVIDRKFSHFEEMIYTLEISIGPDVAKVPSKFPYNRALKVGLSMSKQDSLPAVEKRQESTISNIT